MAKSKEEETHVAVLRETHGKIKALAVAERRSMRAVIVKLVDDAYNKLKDK